jgi:hypothetical protein
MGGHRPASPNASAVDTEFATRGGDATPDLHDSSGRDRGPPYGEAQPGGEAKGHGAQAPAATHASPAPAVAPGVHVLQPVTVPPLGPPPASSGASSAAAAVLGDRAQQPAAAPQPTLGE